MNDVAKIEEAAPQDLKQIILAAEKKFLKINPDPAAFASEGAFFLQILRNSPNLMAVCIENPRSAVAVLEQAAALGLSLNPAKKQSYVLSRNIKIKTHGQPDRWESRLMFEPSYMGLNKIAVDSEGIEWVQARVVRKEDTFIDNGPGLRPTHDYEAMAPREERGPIVGVFCMVKLDTGDYLTTIMTAERLKEIKERSETGKKDYGPWVTDEEEMSMKAVMRTGFKTWPIKSSKMEQAVYISNENEGFEELTTTMPEVTKFTADQKADYDQMIEEENAIDMFLFLDSVTEGVEISLYNSFPAREGIGKGKYQAIVTKLQQSGRAQLEDCRAELTEAFKMDDEMGVGQLVTDLPKEGVEYILTQMDSEEEIAIRKIWNAAKE